MPPPLGIRKDSSSGRGRTPLAPRRRRRASFSSPFKEIFFFSFLLSLSVGSFGCGYTLVGTGASALPPTVKTVYVPTFVNDTTVVGVEQRLTEAVLRELSARGRLKPAADRAQADAELSGRLTSLSVSPVRFDDAGLAVEYQVTVTASLDPRREGDGEASVHGAFVRVPAALHGAGELALVLRPGAGGDRGPGATVRPEPRHDDPGGVLAASTPSRRTSSPCSRSSRSST